MIGIPIEIQKRIRHSGVDKDKRIANIYAILAVRFNQPFSEIRKIPLPMCWRFLQIYDEEVKQMEEMKKKNGRA